jgi:putative ABC transport system permease protein
VASGLLHLETLLFEVTPLDLPTFAAMAALLLTVAALAAWVPARRAMRVDPITVPRER